VGQAPAARGLFYNPSGVGAITTRVEKDPGREIPEITGGAVDMAGGDSPLGRGHGNLRVQGCSIYRPFFFVVRPDLRV